MNEKDIIAKLQQNTAIPDIVREKTDLVFQQIQSERTHKTMKNTNRRWKTVWLPIAAAVLALGTTVCAAVYVQWSKGLETQLEINEEQKEMLIEEQVAAPVYNSVTENDITVTALQTIVADRFAYLAFKVDGYTVEDGIQPDFEYMTLTIDGRDDYNLLMGHFFDGLQMDENGSMEYVMLLMTPYESDSFIGKSLHLELHNLGSVDKAAFTPDINASWTFDFTLQGSDKIRTCKLSEALGDSGATVIEAEISPISLHVIYDMPLQKTTIDAIDANGQAIKSSTFVEAPHLTGVRLKDGTLLTGLTSGGGEGYSDSNDELYNATFATSSIIEPDQVDALLFIKSYPTDDTPLTEENLYIVPVE